MLDRKVPARYIGNHEVRLGKEGGPYFDANGKRLEELLLRQGDTLMMPAHEVLGMTWLTDPKCIEDPVQLGVGKVVLTEHQKLSNTELVDMGYQFHGGRSDFEPLDVQSTEQEKTGDKKKKEAQ